MWFRRSRSDDDPDDPGPGAEPFGAWHDSGVANEVVAFLEGRLVYHYAATGRVAPAWAALNRLAHAARPELARLAAGGIPACSLPRWATSERFLAARILAQAPTPERLDALQSEVLMPLELRLIDQSSTEDLGVEQVMAAATHALETFAG
jgi:hypothetical protein